MLSLCHKLAIMDELHQFSLSQIKELFDRHDELRANNYLSQNLVIARHPNVNLIKSLFDNGPLIMQEMRILIIKQGWTAPIVNLVPQRFEAGDLVFLGVNGIAQISEVSDDARAIAISFSDELFSLAVGNHIPYAFDGHLRDFHIRLTPQELDYADRLHELLYIHTSEENHSPQVTLQLISSFLWYVDHLWNRHENESRRSLTREQRLFTDFIQLVSQYAPLQHHLEFYAERLCLSPRYMSTLVKQVSGKAAKQWIDDAMITRAKVALRHSDKTVAEIAEEMNFPNPSFFCKYFKRLTGLTTQSYRGRQ